MMFGHDVTCEEEAVVRVVSWNVQYGIEVEGAGRQLATDDDLKSADIVLLQEMDEPGTARIAEMLDAHYAYASREPHANTGRDFGNAVISRWPLGDPRDVLLPHMAPVDGHPRHATTASIDVEGRTVTAYSVHTETPQLRLARRVEQFDGVADDARQRGGAHVVVGGDFNTVTERGVRALVRSMAAADLERVSGVGLTSYRRFGRNLPLDHLFAGGFDRVDAGVVSTTEASDHRPIWVELAPRTP